MYKDKEKQKEYNKERMRKVRVTQKGNTSSGNTEPWYPNKRTDDEGNSITPVILSDGQKFYPKKVESNSLGLPNNIYQDILLDGERFGRLEERIRKAVFYQGKKLLEVTS